MFKPKTIKFYDHEGLSYKTQKFLTKNRYYHDEIADQILDFIATLDKSMERIELGWGRFYVSDRNYWALKRLWYKANKELCQYLKYTAEIALEEDEYAH